MFKIDTLMTALWSRDLPTLWDGIRRTITPMAQRTKSSPLSQLLTIFAMIVLPFLLWPTLAFETQSITPNFASYLGNVSGITSTTQVSEATPHSQDRSILDNNISEINRLNLVLSFALDTTLCIIAIIGVGVKCVSKYRLFPAYAFFCLLGGGFLVVCYAYSMVQVLLGPRAKPISWRGRTTALGFQDSKKGEAASA